MQGQLTLTCMPSTQDEETVQTCAIGNPLNSNSGLTVNVVFTPRPELIGSESQVTVDYTVGSVNEEATGTEGDNTRTQALPVNARANIFIDQPG